MRRIWTFVLSLSLLSLPGLSSDAESPKYGGRLVFAIRNDINGLNPFVRTTSTNVYVRQLAYEALLDFDKHGKLVPSLAESWTVSADGKSYLFKLRKGVKFHDGKELGADDVKWSVDYAMDPNNGTTGLSMLKSIERVNVKDKLTVEFVLKNPHAGFLSMVATIRPFPIVPSRSVPSGKIDLPGFPPGTGPFAFKDYKPAREIAFVRKKTIGAKVFPIWTSSS
jgi:peptide/nickel transport system substrate-binding protein